MNTRRTMTTHWLRHLLASAAPGAATLAAAMLAPVAPACAQQAATYRFSLHGLSLDAALRRYARITGRQVIFRSDAVMERPAPALVGTYDADAALALLLAGSPLRAERVRPDVIVISPVGPVVADADPFPSSDGDDRPAPDIVVTGTTIRGRVPAGTAVTRIDRRAIDRSTRGSVAEVIATLPQNSGGTGNEAATLGGIDRTSLNSSLAASPNLRGLGSDATLTLVNGRRQAGSGGRGDFSDLSIIPLAAVERIEVLKDGASAIYGSDAVGGVVNVILKSDYRGAETRLRSTVGAGGSPADRQASQLVGLRWSGGGLLAAYEYDRRGALASSDRAITRSADLRPLGGSDWRSYFSAPGTILRYDPTARAYVPAYAIPAGNDHPQPGDFMPGRNLENQFALSDTLPLQERHSLYGRIDQKLGTAIELFGELRWARRRFAYALPPSTATFAVTRANPYFASPDGSPFSVVAYSFGDDLGAARDSGHVDAMSLTGGVTADITSSWQFDGYYLFSRERTREATSNLVNTDAIAEALGTSPDNPATSYSAPRDGYFNPYGSGTSNNRAVLDFIGSGRSGSWRRSALQSAVGKFDGPLLALPAGTMRLAVGGAWRRETLASGGYDFETGTAPRALAPGNAARDITALFAEVSVPVFDESRGTGIGKLDLSAAVRHERYSDFGGTTNPRIGATWRIVPRLDLRASWGTSFRAPSLPEIHAPFSVAPTQLATAAGSLTPVLFESGGNDRLRPETAKTWSAGIGWRPAKAVRIDLGYFRTAFSDRIDRPVLQLATRALTDPTLRPFVRLIDPANDAADLALVEALLASPGAIDANALPPTAYRAIVDGRYVNTARVTVDGIDFDASAETPVAGGSLSLGLGASYLLDYRRKLTPAAPDLQLVSTVGYPARFKARGSLDWSKGIFGATLSSSMVGAYRDTDSLPVRPVSSWVTVDLQLRATPRVKGGFSIALDIRNVFDSAPPFVDRAGGIGYDAANADILGRVVGIELSRRW